MYCIIQTEPFGEGQESGWGLGVRPAIDILLKNELTLIEGMPTANKTK